MKHANLAFFVPHAGCQNACSFCNQRVISGRQSMPTPQEIESACQAALRARSGALEQTEIAFFGGSFTAIPQEEMLSLLRAAFPFTGPGGFAGIRISTRPDAVSLEVLRLLARWHVTAVELGAQSMCDRVLLQNGRGHTARQVCEAAEMVRAAGMELGLQMMTGLYGSRPEDDRETARRLADLQPDTVRIYPTVVLRGTALERLWRQGIYIPQTVEQAAELGAELLELFTSKGIRVIRLGLHASESLEEDRVAGPYHPAMRELCESRLWRKKLCALLEKERETNIIVTVGSREVSKVIGQKRENLLWFAQRGWRLRIRGDDSLSPGTCRIEAQGTGGEPFAVKIVGDPGL